MSWTINSEILTWRVKLTIDKDQIDANLTDKDVYVDIATLASADIANMKSDAGDLRATLGDGTTPIPLAIRYFNQGAETGQVYIKVSSVSSSVDTDIYLYWGNAALSQPAADATYGSENVPDGNYIAFQPLGESGDGSADEYPDMTSNDNHGQGGGGTGTKVPTQTTGFGGRLAQEFDGSDDHINLGNDATLDLQGAMTFSCLVRHNVNNANQVFGIKASADGSGVLPYECRSTSTADFHYAINTQINTWVGTLAIDTDRHVAFTYDGTTTGTNKFMYRDASALISAAQTVAMGTNESVNLTLGAMDNPTNFNPLNGMLAEARLSNTDRSVEWIKADKVNQLTPGTFYSVGTSEESPIDDYFGSSWF
jgi:hypothetical protein